MKTKPALHMSSDFSDRQHGRERERAELDDTSGSHDDDDRQDDERRHTASGRKLSKDDLQDLAKMSSDLVRRTLLSGIDIVKDVGKELPKEATQFLAARREQVLQNVSKDVIQLLINSSIDRLFQTVREHRVDVSFRIVRDRPKEQEAEVRGRNDRGHKARSKRTDRP